MGNVNGKRKVKQNRNLLVSPFKIILLGDREVGKSSILMRYAKNQFSSEYIPTRNARIENVVKKVNLPGDVLSSVTMWDLPGAEDLDLKDTYYRDVDAAIVVVDMNNESSIRLAGAWKQDLSNRATRTRLVPHNNNSAMLQQIPCTEPIPVLLMGNKYDKIVNQVEAPERKDAEVVVHPDDLLDHNMPEDVQRQLEAEKKKDNKNNEITPDENKDFPTILGPKNNERKPECVKLLEKIEEDYGFVGSVMVSAADGDPSVQLAVQSLVRFLLQQHLPEKQHKKKPVAEKQHIEDETAESLLLETGYKEFDDLFKRCLLPLRRSAEYGECLAWVMRRFKETCAECGMLTVRRPSFEDCLLGIRHHLRTLMDTLHLIVVEDDEFLSLEHSKDDRVKVPREVPMCLEVFNKQLVPVCRAILRDGPAIDALLLKLDEKIAGRCQDIATLLPHAGPAHHARAVHVADQNRARIAFGRKQIQDCVAKVHATREKTKAACVW